jgi:hypothetical protein
MIRRAHPVGHAPVGVRDLDANTPGAQADVVACTDRIGAATLETGLKGGTLTLLAGPITTVAASATDNCPSGLGFVARFPGVTLPRAPRTRTARWRRRPS